MNLHQWRLLKFAVGEDPFNIFYVQLEQEGKYQFQIEELHSYSAGSRANYHDDAASFWLIVDQIKDHRVFKSKKRQQAPLGIN
jgi:hypothetical protein